MTASRLSLALDTGQIDLPEEGLIAVFGPSADYDLSAIGKERVRIVTRVKTDFDAFSKQGYVVSQGLPEAPAVVVLVLPRAKALAKARVAAAAATGAPVIVDGEKTNGVDSIYRDIAKRANVTPAWSKAHGKIFQIERAQDFNDWAASPSEIDSRFMTVPGIFSADAIDRASALLAETLPAGLEGNIADLGAGWGYLSIRALEACSGIKALHLVESDGDALDCAKKNVSDPRAVFHWADATTWHTPVYLNAVIMNPPFHLGRSADPSLGRAFIESAAGMLSPKGQLLMVANRHLPYEQTLDQHFAEQSEIGGDSGFKMIAARKPRRKK